MENWKTNASGAALILGALADIATGLAHGTVSGNLPADLTAIIGGIGLIFAKDAK